MKHARSGKKLGRTSAHRKALYSNLAGALITHGRIQTTEAKAKAVKPFAEIAPRFSVRPGGYTRIVKLGPRQGDAAEMVYLELVDYEPATAFAAPGSR